MDYNGHSYQIIEINGDWSDAKRYCEAKDGYLATITSAEENEVLYTFMHEAGYGSAYFGFTDRVNEGQWVWENGETVSYTNWEPGEPNSENSEEDYGMFYEKFGQATWNDGRFGTARFICEWDYELEDQ